MLVSLLGWLVGWLGVFMFHPPPQAIRAEIFRLSVFLFLARERNTPRARLRRKGTTENNPNRCCLQKCVTDNNEISYCSADIASTEPIPNQRTFSVNPFVGFAAWLLRKIGTEGMGSDYIMIPTQLSGRRLPYDNTWVIVTSCGNVNDGFLRYFVLYN